MLGMTRSLFARVVTLMGAIFWGPMASGAEVDRIEAQEAKRLVDKGEAVVIDVRSRSAWDLGHVAGAVHVPLAEIDAHLSRLPKNKLIVAYCT
jgi:rhodanese-related sulfurtransferase